MQRLDGLGNQERVGLDYKELPNDVDVGTVLLLNDGMLEFHVTEVKGRQVHLRRRARRCACPTTRASTVRAADLPLPR